MRTEIELDHDQVAQALLDYVMANKLLPAGHVQLSGWIDFTPTGPKLGIKVIWIGPYTKAKGVQ